MDKPSGHPLVMLSGLWETEVRLAALDRWALEIGHRRMT